ncbi:MAG: dTDP-4-dehydrorhamnose 3,5-epimerase [Dissulfurispiraceae bacterium]|nr:dTDP-4-dehydrorhamnose 3,5-epimerase [Dissulfurispiraceae bacterium]
MSFKFKQLEIPDVVLITPEAFSDSRGLFMETYKKSEFSANGIDCSIKQINFSVSAKNVLRGLHYQLKPHAQAKLVQCLRGSAYDVAVDIRNGSPYFGRWVSAVLTAENRNLLWVPEGFAHGFLALEDNTEIMYGISSEYAKDSERGIIWNDPDISINWPSNEIILSEKDTMNIKLSDAEINFIYGD